MIIYGYEEQGNETTAYVENLDIALDEAKRYSNRVHFEVTVTKYWIQDGLSGRALACLLLNGNWASQSEEIRKFRHGKLVRKERTLKAASCEICGQYPAMPKRDICEGCDAYKEHQA